MSRSGLTGPDRIYSLRRYHHQTARQRGRRPGFTAGRADAKETVPCQLTQTPRADAGF